MSRFMLERTRLYAPTVILGFLIFYFAFQALTGDRGLLSAHRRQTTLAARMTELRDLEAQRSELAARIRLLNPGSLSADLLEERARSLLGFVRPNEYVIRMPVSAG